jgi:hypothetical protein
VIGLKLRGLDQDADRVSVQSSEQSSHLLTRRRFSCLPVKWTEVWIAPEELMILKCNGGTTAIDIKHIGGTSGALLIDEGGERRRRLQEGQVVRLVLERDRAVFLKTQQWKAPRGSGVAMPV